MQSWFSFELDGETCRVEHALTGQTLASFLAGLAPCFSHFADHDPFLAPRLVIMGVVENNCHRFRVVDAGLVFMPSLADQQIWTPEGIRTAEPEHPVNLAFVEGGFECATERIDNIIALTFEGYYRPDLRKRSQMYDQFDAIATRTANVSAIRESALQVFASTEQLRFEMARRAERSGDERTVWSGKKDIFGDRFTRQLFRQTECRALQFVDGEKRRFFRPDNLVDLLKLRQDYPSASLVAGGAGLAIRGAEAVPDDCIALDGVRELSMIETTEEQWDIGAAVSLTQLVEQIGRECHPFAKLLCRFATRPIRNRATLGGYLASPFPSGQITALLIALNARVRILSTEGERDISLSQFFVEGGASVLKRGEIIRSILIPRSTESALATRGITTRLCDAYSVGPQRTGCIPYVTGAFALELRSKKITKAWIAYSGIADAPVRAREAEDSLIGKTWGEKSMIETLPILQRSIEVQPVGEPGADYRKQLVGTLFQKFYYQHPEIENIRPKQLTATTNFAKLEEPFHDTVIF